MPLRTNTQSKVLHALLFKRKLYDDRASYVLAFTSGRETSTTKLTMQECQELINHLNAHGNDMRKKVLSICHQLGWYVRVNERLAINPSTQKPMLDMKRINDWCKKYSHVHKNFNDHAERELPTLITQFQRVLTSHLNKPHETQTDSNN